MAKPAKKMPRLLLADDDEDDFILLRGALADAGLTVPLEWARDGRELLDMMARGGSGGGCIIILDLNMPRMDGRQTLRRIRGDEKLRGTPVIVMTSSTRAADVADCYRSGASSFIRKPASGEERRRIARIFKSYWTELVELPVPGGMSCPDG